MILEQLQIVLIPSGRCQKLGEKVYFYQFYLLNLKFYLLSTKRGNVDAIKCGNSNSFNKFTECLLYVGTVKDTVGDRKDIK